MLLLRKIISLFVGIEILFTSAFAGGYDSAFEMPESKAGSCGSYVDVFTGTGGIPWTCGMLSPAATVPFGCVRPGPDTSAANGLYLFKTNTSGYYYEHRHILGFSYGRLSGTGIRDYGMFRVTPDINKSGADSPSVHAFSHDRETGYPGYYAVYLPGAAVLAEMTATSHTGYQRYTFSSGKDASIYIDAASCLSSGTTENAKISVDRDSRTVTASVTVKGGFSDRFGGLPVYYYAEFDRDLTSSDSSGSAVRLHFGDLRNKPLTLRAGISFVSAENAKKNLYAEAENKDFDTVRNDAVNLWEERLSSIKVNGSDSVKRNFYTSLYHTMIMPTDFTDSDGSYKGFDKETHTADGFTYRTDMSLWDTARNAHALYTLIAGDVQNDCLKSLLLMADQGGVLPRWPMGEGYTGSMFGNPANLVFTESYLKGIENVDYGKALDYMVKSAKTSGNREDREFLELYNEYGYIPEDKVADESRNYSVSRVLEYSWEDAAASVLAGKLGNSEIENEFGKMSQRWKNIWDPSAKYFRAKNSDGSFAALTPHLTAFYDDIFGTSFSDPYCEGSARQWRWNALNNIEGMISLFGSDEYFVSELESFMKDASPKRAAIDPGSGFWIGNQHDIHTPYLFSDAGRSDLTQKWVRWTLDNRFATGADGLDGNDDGGTLSAWYVFSSLGFYPLAGTDKYWIGSPCVDSAELTLSNGSILKIEAVNQSEKNIYVSSVTFNGREITGNYISHDLISGGGTLRFNMSDKAK